MKNLANSYKNGTFSVEKERVVKQARRRNNELHFRTLTLAEHVYRRAQTEIFIANNNNKNKDFEILSNICDNYAGWLSDDDIVWTFIDESAIRWNHTEGEVELILKTYEKYGKYRK